MVESMYVLAGIFLALSGMIAWKLLMMIPIVRFILEKLMRK